MSVAEKLKAEGRVEGRMEGRVEGREEGRSEGFWIGKIQAFQEFLGEAQSSRDSLECLALAELEALHAKLHREYELRFKR
jgi:predicted transposase YdaD